MHLRFVVLGAATTFVACAVVAQDYPSRTARIVTAEAGGSNDIATRIIAQPLGAALGQQFIVENMGQASGVIAAQTVATATSDGTELRASTPEQFGQFVARETAKFNELARGMGGFKID